MSTINITTSQNIDVEYELGSLGDRILGRILDYIVIGAYVLIIFFSIGVSNFGSFFQDNYWIIILFILPVFCYDLLSEIFLNGQTLGKRIMKIKVISLTGSQPSLGQYLIRWLFRPLDFTFTFSVVALVMVAVTERRQRLGDVVAGTTLVKTTPRTHFHQTIYEPVAENNYEVTYPEVVHLKDHDIQLIKEVINTVNKTGNTMLALQASQKIEQVLNIMRKQPEPKQFLHVILADYNHLTSSM